MSEDEVAARLRTLLEARGSAWPGPIEHLEDVPSTSDVLRERARAGAPEWSVVLADSQTAGRGRQGRSWLSPPGNLCLSILLRPSLAAVGVLPLAAGVALAEACAGWGIDARLKWPNDVLVGGRKLAGILVEAVSSGRQVESAIVGIGMNLALDEAAAPPELRPSLTSVLRESGRAVDQASAAAAVLARLGVWYHALADDGPARVIAAWRALSVPWWGKAVEVESGSRRLRGIARDVDAGGALVLEGSDGARLVVISGEARLLRLGAETDA